MKRPCLGQCGRLVSGSRRCPACARSQETRRGTRQQRGYNTGHDRARRTIAAQLPAPCGYCPHLVMPSDRWVAAHVVDGDPSEGWMPAHALCNERAKVRGGYRETERSAGVVPAPTSAPRASGQNDSAGHS